MSNLPSFANASGLVIRPRLSDTDALGHVNNTSVTPWLEEGRTHLCWHEAQIEQRTVLVRLEIDYLAEIHYRNQAVDLYTLVDNLGTSSISYRQLLFQGDTLCLDCRAVSVAFNLETRRSEPLTDDTRRRLAPYLTHTARS